MKWRENKSKKNGEREKYNNFNEIKIKCDEKFIGIRKKMFQE